MEPFLGQITLVAFNFAPVGWAFCDGHAPVHRPESGAVSTDRHDLRRRRSDDVRPAGPAQSHSAAPGPERTAPAITRSARSVGPRT